MDLVASCRAFVAVSASGSFTVGAAAVGMAQSAASRRIAALEQHVGEPLLDRSSRSTRLTAAGSYLLPSARRLVEQADALEQRAGQARQRPVRLAVPLGWSVPATARLIASARRAGVPLEVSAHPCDERAQLARTGEVRAALLPAPADASDWRVRLGLGSASADDPPVVHLDTLRPSRTRSRTPRRVWLLPEDDVPHVRDVLHRCRDRAGLQPGQVSMAASAVSATADALAAGDLVLCSRGQARQLGLAWHRIGGVDLHRGYRLAAADPQDADRLRSCLGADLERCVAEDPTGASG